MEYIKEDQILLHEELCGESLEDDELTKCTIRFRENIKLANSIAMKMSPSRDGVIDRDDILQLAYLGLWLACMKYDESKGIAFSTFAVPYIRGTIFRAFRENGALKEPRVFHDMRADLNKHGFTLPLTDEEVDILISEGRFSRKQIVALMQFSISHLDDPILDTKDEGLTLGDTIASIKDIQYEFTEDEIESIIDKILSYMKPNHRDLIEEWLYSVLEGTPVKQRVLSKKYKMSQANVNRTLKSAIMIAKMNQEEIRELLGI